MYVAFDTLPDTARLWVYAAGRPFTAAEKSLIEETAPGFLQQWTAHGKSLQAGYTILHDQFLLLAVNEAEHQASGCSIDASVNYVRSLEKELQLLLTDRSQVSFWQGDKVKTVKLPELKEAVTSGDIRPESTLINTLVATKGELQADWHKKAADSWLKRYFKAINA